VSLDTKDLAESIAVMSGVDAKKCMKCGKCTATCPSNEYMDVHPHRFVMLAEEGDIETLLQSKSLWKCLSCFACVERCPRGVEPANLIEAIRLTLVRGKGGSYKSPDDIPQLAAFDEEIPQQLVTSVLRKYNR